MPTRPPTFRPPFAPTKAERQADHDRRRGSAARRGYGRGWQKASKAFLAKHPLCAICLKEGRTTAATCVDHIKAHKGDMKLFWDRSNWQSACDPCNARKAATEEGGFGRPASVGRGVEKSTT